MEMNRADGQPSDKVKKERYVLQVPPDFSFKGEPPHWARQLFLEPLVEGWKREIVIRNTPLKNKTADIYYFSPDGTKFRSRREIGQYLQDEGITKYSPVFNFWFCGKILGKEFSPYEVVRQSHQSFKREGSCSSKSQPDPEDILSEEEMVYDEEIEIDSGQVAVFDPAVLSSLNEPRVPIALPIIKEKREPKLQRALFVSKEKRDPKEQGALPITKEKRIPVNIPKKRKFVHQEPTTIETKTPERRYCICDDVEHGQMVFCDNTNCEIGWYHFKCVNIQQSPPGSWFCPICRGPTSDVLNPAYGVQKELCR